MRSFTSCTVYYGNVVATINFICQVDFATESPDIWTSTSLEVFVIIFEDINMWISRLNKADCSPMSMALHPIS